MLISLNHFYLYLNLSNNLVEIIKKKIIVGRETKYQLKRNKNHRVIVDYDNYLKSDFVSNNISIDINICFGNSDCLSYGGTTIVNHGLH